MLISINPNDGMPIYRQLVQQFKSIIASGQLVRGEQMPSQRELASELVISHLTVKKAYEILEAEGVVETLRGRGTFVSMALNKSLQRKSMKQLKAQIDNLQNAAKLLGVKRDDCVQMLKKAWRGK